jgi:hypothetical protein
MSNKAIERGLWADPSPTPPWDFRRGKTAKAPGATPSATASGPIVCVLAAVTAYVKLRQKYRGEKSKAGPG